MPFWDWLFGRKEETEYDFDARDFHAGDKVGYTDHLDQGEVVRVSRDGQRAVVRDADGHEHVESTSRLLRRR